MTYFRPPQIYAYDIDITLSQILLLHPTNVLVVLIDRYFKATSAKISKSNAEVMHQLKIES